jgi:hypothetical protein
MLIRCSLIARAGMPGFRRLPARDWQPSPDMQLLAYGLVLYGRQ